MSDKTKVPARSILIEQFNGWLRAAKISLLRGHYETARRELDDARKVLDEIEGNEDA